MELVNSSDYTVLGEHVGSQVGGWIGGRKKKKKKRTLKWKG